MLAGGLELTHEYGVLVGMPLGEGPFSLEGQVGPGGGGGSLSLAWRMRGPGAEEGLRQGVMWFVSAGIGPYFRTSSPGQPTGGVYTLIGGLRMVSGGGSIIRITPEGGLAFEGGIGVFQTIGSRNPDGLRRGVAGRLAVGWQF